MNISLIQQLLLAGNIRWTSHSLERMGERDVSIEDVKRCIATGEIIEEYPDDYPYPSCLFFGYTLENREIHVVVGCDEEKIYIITDCLLS